MEKDSKAEATGRAAPTPFSEFLLTVRDGDALEELTDSLAAVAAGVHQHGKAGSLKLTVQLQPGPTPGSVIVKDKVEASVPQEPRPATMFFSSEDGRVSRRHPGQLDLGELRKDIEQRDNTTEEDAG